MSGSTWKKDIFGVWQSLEKDGTLSEVWVRNGGIVVDPDVRLDGPNVVLTVEVLIDLLQELGYNLVK